MKRKPELEPRQGRGSLFAWPSESSLSLFLSLSLSLSWSFSLCLYIRMGTKSATSLPFLSLSLSSPSLSLSLSLSLSVSLSRCSLPLSRSLSLSLSLSFFLRNAGLSLHFYQSSKFATGRICHLGRCALLFLLLLCVGRVVVCLACCVSLSFSLFLSFSFFLRNAGLLRGCHCVSIKICHRLNLPPRTVRALASPLACVGRVVVCLACCVSIVGVRGRSVGESAGAASVAAAGRLDSRCLSGARGADDGGGMCVDSSPLEELEGPEVPAAPNTGGHREDIRDVREEARQKRTAGEGEVRDTEHSVSRRSKFATSHGYIYDAPSRPRCPHVRQASSD